MGAKQSQLDGGNGPVEDGAKKGGATKMARLSAKDRMEMEYNYNNEYEYDEEGEDEEGEDEADGVYEPSEFDLKTILTLGDSMHSLSQHRPSALLDLPLGHDERMSDGSVSFEGDDFYDEQPLDSHAHRTQMHGLASKDLAIQAKAPENKNRQGRKNSSEENGKRHSPSNDRKARGSKGSMKNDAKAALKTKFLYADDPDVHVVELQRDSADSFGFSFVGPRDGDALELAGVFITRVRSDSAAAACKKLRRGQQILAVDGEDMVVASLNEFARAIKHKNSITLEVKYDLKGFRHYDKGEEIRRVSLIAFAHVPQDEVLEPQTVKASYFGCQQIQTDDPVSMHAAFKKLRKKPAPGHRKKLLITISQIDMIVSRKSSKKIPPRKHYLIDVTRCIGNGNVLALASNDMVDNERILQCHIFVFKNVDAANEACALIKARCTDGFARMRRNLLLRAKPSRPRSVSDPKNKPDQGLLDKYEQTLRESRKGKPKGSPEGEKQRIKDKKAALHKEKGASPSSQQRHKQRSRSGSSSQEHTSEHHTTAVIDFRGTPLPEQPWFIPSLSPTEAEDLLERNSPMGGFLVVPGKQKGHFVLCVKETPTQARSYSIEPVFKDSNIVYVLTNRPKSAFSNVVQLIWFYGSHAYHIDRETQAHYTLRFPRHKKKAQTSAHVSTTSLAMSQENASHPESEQSSQRHLSSHAEHRRERQADSYASSGDHLHTYSDDEDNGTDSDDDEDGGFDEQGQRATNSVRMAYREAGKEDLNEIEHAARLAKEQEDRRRRKLEEKRQRLQQAQLNRESDEKRAERDSHARTKARHQPHQRTKRRSTSHTSASIATNDPADFDSSPIVIVDSSTT